MCLAGVFSFARRHSRSVLLLTVVCCSLASGEAQTPGSVDQSFDPTGGGALPGFTSGPGEIQAFEILGDGKLLFGGEFVGYSGTPRRGIARANADGSLDTTFFPGAEMDGAVLALAVQADEKVIVGGQFTLLGSSSRFSLVRLHPEGSLDAGFVADVKTQADKGSVRTLALQGDGKVLVGGSFDRVNGVISFSLARLNTDGSVDRSFSSGELFKLSGSVDAIVVLESGKVLVAGFLGNQAVIYRLNADGTPDQGFINELTGCMVRTLAVRHDGKILAAGQVKVPSGSGPEEAMVLLNEDGSVAQDFPVLKAQISRLQVQPDDKVIVTGWFHELRGVPRMRVARLNANGSLDESFDPGDTLGRVDYLILPRLAADGRMRLSGHFELPNGTSTALVRLGPDGRLDETFHAQAPPVRIAARPGSLAAVVVLPAGALMAGGSFSAVNDRPRANLARLLPNGLVDPGFRPQWNNGFEVVALLRQEDGRFLVGGRGSFLDADSQTRRGLVRLNSDGSLDSEFTSPWSDSWNMRLHCLALQPDGKVLVAGEFENGVARLKANGGLDETFRPPVIPAYDGDAVHAILVQPDGRIIAGGTQGIGLFRLNPDGSPDPTFRCDPALSVSVHALALQPDGLLVGGWLSSGCEEGNRNLVRLWNDGTLDRRFKAEVAIVPQGIVPLADGRMLVAGAAAYPSQTAPIYCLMPDGSLDTNFTAAAGVMFGVPAVQSVAVNDESRVLVSGVFSTINGHATDCIARLHNHSLTQAPKTYLGPVSVTRFVGQTAEFSVHCAGSPPFSYQWFFDGEALPGETASVLRITPLSLEHAGRFFATITNSVGGVISETVTLTVMPVWEGPGSIDITFDPTRGGRLQPLAGTWSGNIWERAVRTLALQPDGRCIIGGVFSGIEGMPRNNLARLQIDGRLDYTFDASWGTDGEVNHVALQSDGKIVVSGYFATVQGVRRQAIARLHPDGTLDRGFEVLLEGGDPRPVVWRTWVQPNGSIILFGSYNRVNGVPRYNLARLKADGSLDPDFNADSITGVELTHISACELLKDGGLLLGGGFPAAAGQRMVRLNLDGTLDPVFVPWFSAATVYALAEQNDGRIVVSTSHHGVLRLQSDGSADPSFAPVQVGGGFPVGKVGILWDGRIIIAGHFTSVNGVVGFHSLAVLNSDGILDNVTNLPLLMEGTHGDSFVMLPDAKAVIIAEDDQLADQKHSFYLLEPPNTFRLLFTNEVSAPYGTLDQVLPEPDGKIFISGGFTRWNNIPRPGLARLLSDGTLDPGFYPNVGVFNSVQCHALDSEGKLYITAAFPVNDGEFCERHAVGRLYYDGSLDRTFGGGMVDVEETIATPNTVALQPDGKVLVGGYPYRNPAEYPSVARVTAEGSVDSSFHAAPVYVGDDYGILELGIQSDGKIVLGGELVPVRYLPTGELDPTFQSDLVWGTLQRLIVLPDDRLLVSGWFTPNDVTWLYVARLLPNGRLDPSFNAPPGFVSTIAAQPDGRVLVAYEKELIRLNPDGSVDPSFPAVRPNSLIRRIALQSDGGILIGGDFTAVNGIPCKGLARLNNVVFPVLRPLPFVAGQPFRLALAGTPGLYSIEWSADLKNWTVAGTVTVGIIGQCEFATQPGSEPGRFYRARQQARTQ